MKISSTKKYFKKFLCVFFALFILSFAFSQENYDKQDPESGQESEQVIEKKSEKDGKKDGKKKKTTKKKKKKKKNSKKKSKKSSSKDKSKDKNKNGKDSDAKESEDKVEEKLSAVQYNAVLSIKVSNDPKIVAFLKAQKGKKKKARRRSTKVLHKFRGGVTEIVNAGNKPLFFVAGNDGFVSRYSYPKLTADTWQFSDMPIKKIAVHPKGNLLAIYESDGFSVHQVSLWDWEMKKNIFSKRLADSVVSLSWSARGNYLFIGNRSVDGISVLNKQGRLLKIYKQAPGIVFLAATASSESSIVTYGESGRLVYTSINARKKLKEFKTESFLRNPNVIDNFKRLIGYKSNKVFLISALSGKILKEYPAREAIFAAKLKDKTPIWIQRARRRSQWCIRQGDAESQAFYIPGHSKITAARHIKNHMIIGTADGSIYMISLNVDSTVKIEDPLDYTFTDIDDIVSDGKSLFVLKRGTLYSISSHKADAEIVDTGFRTNRFIYYKDGFILWSDYRRGLPIYYYSLKTKSIRKIVYPKEPIISLSTYKDSILYVESFNGVSVVDFESRKTLFQYNAPGIQNAVQVDKDNIIIAKSSIDKAQSPVFIINTETKETLPISIEGKLAFALQQNPAKRDKLNCFLLSAKPIKKTELLRIHLNKKDLKKSKFKAVLSYKDEDLNAFLTADKYDILTNLGKGSIVCYNVLSKQTKRLKRSYSLSKKAIILKDYFVSLNYGGTISWYDRKTKKIMRTHGLDKKKSEEKSEKDK